MSKNKGKVVAAVIGAAVSLSGLLYLALAVTDGRGNNEANGNANVGTFNTASNGNRDVVRALTQMRSSAHDVPLSTARDWKRMRRLEQLWQEREQREVTPELISFLEDPNFLLRQRAARLLGRLENPAAQESLNAILERVQKRDSNLTSTISSTTLQLALARIGSRGLKGEARLGFLAESLGLSTTDLARLSQEVNGARRSGMRGTAGDEVLQEIVHLLYTMGKKGENASFLAAQLKMKLTPQQQLKLQIASLPQDQEIKSILDYLSHLGVVTPDDYELVEHLAGLGPDAADAIIRRLTEMKQNRERYWA